MLQARDEIWSAERAGAEVVAFPNERAATRPGFGRRAPRRVFDLVVDLRTEEIGLRWLRGAGTLAALCSTALFLVPGYDPQANLPPPRAPAIMKTVPLSELAGPQLPLETPDSALPRAAGVQSGEKDGIKRISGSVTEGLYWSLRAAGATPGIATEYLKALATHTDVGDVAPLDRFDFALRKGSGGQPDQLVYAALDRLQSDDVKLLRWTVDGRTAWFDGSPAPQVSAGLMSPVAGRITSGFGYRYHPILHFSRFHSGIDFGARWGSPILAAADGQVTAAGYSGGYGRQVRIAHEGGMMTTYSHMSSILASPGLPVRQGQVIGYVGSSGLSTGPHLHFEVRRNGRPVNPMTARLVSRPVFEGPQLAAFKARLKEMLAIPMKPQPATDSQETAAAS